MPRSARNWFAHTALGVVLTACAGCSSKPQGYDQVVPPPAMAQQALSAALQDWQQGRSAGRIDRVSPPVVVVDSHRSPTQPLEKFEVLGEVPAENARSFSVRLSLAHPDEQVLARYNVFGRDPVWVFRLEDYEMISHWEHAMGPSSEGESTALTKAGASAR